MSKRVCIIGGGPAGVMAAIFASKNHSVTVFEKDEVLKTILPTGGGRCNLAYNEFDTRELAKFYPRGEKFLYSVFSQFSTNDTINFFKKIGIETYVQEDSRIFPTSNSSKIVKKALLNELQDIKIKKEKVISVKHTNDIFKVQTQSSKYDFDAIIIATGSKGGYEIARKLGHNIIATKPALTALKTTEKAFYSLSGISLHNLNAEVYFENKKKKTVKGDLLFTHQGISGPLVYKISSYCAYEEFSEKNPLKIIINLVNRNDATEFENEFSKKLEKESKKDILNLISLYVPKNLARAILEYNNLNPQTKSGQLKREERKLIIQNLTSFTLHATGRCNGEEIVTAGGVDLKEVNSKRMESKLVNNLYFCGEVLDIDGLTGGFNLQNCWSTGYIAGCSV